MEMRERIWFFEHYIRCVLQTSDFIWHCLHSYAFLADITNKGTRLDVGKKFFDRVLYLNCCNAVEKKAPLSYREVEKVMQRELRDQCLYEYPRGVSIKMVCASWNQVL